MMCESRNVSASALAADIDHKLARFDPEALAVLLRKEVIQPHLPVRLPCYDLVPLTNHTFVDTLLAVK